MRLHRFFIEETIGNKAELNIHSAELVNQIRRVFRLKTEDSVVVFDGSGSDYTCRIEDFGKNDVTLAVSGAAKSRYMPARDIYLCAAVVKKDTFEWIVEKATELGVTHIIPVMAERSEKKSLNESRLKKIAVEASEQSGRGNVPVIQPVLSLKEVIESVRGLASYMIAFHTDAEPWKRLDLDSSAPIAIFVGPEGGWSIDEIGLFHSNQIKVVCLGRQVLRAETAVIAALSEVVFV
jgi:16S rRNA (uracil1498-N3)-methyltransferase